MMGSRKNHCSQAWSLPSKPPSNPMRLLQAQLGPEHHPTPPPPVFLSSTLKVWALRQCSRLCARAGCAHRERSGIGAGPILGVATQYSHCCCLPGRQWVLPQWFREQPFPAGTSPRKPIPGKEPRAGSAFPAALSAQVPSCGGTSLSSTPCKGRPSLLTYPRAEGRTRDFQSIFLPCLSIDLFSQLAFIHPPPTLCTGGNFQLPSLSLYRGYHMALTLLPPPLA